MIFDRFQTKGYSELYYLELFDRYLIDSMKFVVSKDQKTLFDSFVSSLFHGISIHSYNDGLIWDYGQLVSDSNIRDDLNQINDLNAQLDRLNEGVKCLSSFEAFKGWLDSFNEFKDRMNPSLTPEQNKNAFDMENEIIQYAATQFKYNNLLRLVFVICSYCLFKQRADYIKYIWEYKQPSDSDATWVGHDVIPDGLSELVRFYFGEMSFRLRRIEFFWDDHHGSSVYVKRYFLLLLARTLEKNDKGYDASIAFNLPSMDDNKLSSLVYEVDELIEIAKELKSERALLESLGFDKNNLDKVFDVGLEAFLASLKSQAQKKIIDLESTKQISKQRVKEFKQNVIEGFNEKATIRSILNYYNLFEDSTFAHIVDKERFGMSYVDHKAAFFDSWHVSYGKWGTKYGEGLANSENLDLLSRLLSYCHEVKVENFEDVLHRFKDLTKVIILTTNPFIHRQFEGTNKYIPKWRDESKGLNVKGFVGRFSFKNKSIPVLRINSRSARDQVMVLNMRKFGKLIQYSPLFKNESGELQEGRFYMNVVAFSHEKNKDILEKHLANPPKWLRDHGDRSKQEEYLKRRVLIEIYEKYDFEKHDDFEGYLVRLEGKEN